MHDTTLVKTINALKRRENPKYALELLEKMASLVAPIMRAHKMKVGVLTEFCPKNPNLLGLNVNHGMKICVRLRPAGGERGFYPLEFCLGTLLHELTHNFYGPHDDKFYKFLDSLKNEYYTLVASGFTGEGFNSKGHILGSRGNNSNYHNLTQAEVRLKALKAAQNRKTSFSTPIHSTNLSGRKLGTFNNSSLAGKIKSKNSLKTLIREAAERRAADAKWCANGIPYQVVKLDSEDDDIVVMNSPLKNFQCVHTNNKRGLNDFEARFENNAKQTLKPKKPKISFKSPLVKSPASMVSLPMSTSELDMYVQKAKSDAQESEDGFAVIGEAISVDLTSD